MISFKRAYVANLMGKESVFATLEDAQRAELTSLAAEFNLGNMNMTMDDWTGLIVSQKERIIAILTLNDASRPRARGQKKPRKKAQDELPLAKEDAA